MRKLLKSQAVGFPVAKNQQGRTFDETCCVHTCTSKESKKYRKSNNEEGGDKQKKIRTMINNEKQDLFQFLSV